MKKPPPKGGGTAIVRADQQPHPQPPLLPPQPQLLPQPLPQNRNSRMIAMMIQQQLLPPKQEF